VVGLDDHKCANYRSWRQGGTEGKGRGWGGSTVSVEHRGAGGEPAVGGGGVAKVGRRWWLSEEEDVNRRDGLCWAALLGPKADCY
jgi:hypothetical protein